MNSNGRPRHKSILLRIPDFIKMPEIHTENEIIFSKWCLLNWTAVCTRIKIDPYLSAWKNSTTLKLIKEKVDNCLASIHMGHDFVHITPLAQPLRSAISEWILTKLKSFYKSKDTDICTKWQQKKFKKIFTNYSTHRELISKICNRLNSTRYQENK